MDRHLLRAVDLENEFAFRNSVQSVLIETALAGLKGHWHLVGHAIGSLEADVWKCSRRYNIRPHSPYLSTLFLTTAQRNLQLNLPIELLNATIDTVSCPTSAQQRVSAVGFRVSFDFLRPGRPAAEPERFLRAERHCFQDRQRTF